MSKPLSETERIQKIYQEILNIKAQASKTNSEVTALKQNHLQKYLPSYVSITALLTSFLLGYLASKWAFKSQVKLEEQKKGKELEFKNMEINLKKEEEFRKLYMEAQKYQPGILLSSRTATKIHISITCMARKYSLTKADSPEANFYLAQMEEQKKPFFEHNSIYLSDFKNYLSALAGYKMMKSGQSKINTHISKITNGIMFDINTAKLDTLTAVADVDAFMKEEKERFMTYWNNEIKKETNDALEIMLKNE